MDIECWMTRWRALESMKRPVFYVTRREGEKCADPDGMITIKVTEDSRLHKVVQDAIIDDDYRDR